MSGRLFQPLECLRTDNVLDAAGAGLRSFRVNAYFDQVFGEKAVALVDFFCNLPFQIGQVKEVIFVHREEAASLQKGNRMAYTGL